MHFSSALYVHTRHTGFFSIGVGICTPVLPPLDIQYKYTMFGIRIQWIGLKMFNSRAKTNFGA